MTETLILILILAFANALLINGLKKAFEFELIPEIPGADYVHAGGFDPVDSMVFGKIHYNFNKKFGAKLCKPLFSCVPCMASVHSLYVFWPVALCLFPFSLTMLAVYALYIPAVSALGMVIQNKVI